VNPFSDVDPWGLVALIVSGGALFGLGKWATRSGATHFNLPNQPPVDLSLREPRLFPRASDTSLSAPEFGSEPELGTIRIVKFYFTKFDLNQGPENPLVFYDELFVELYDADSGHRWTSSYGVATPAGLSKILEDKSWSYLYANGIVVVEKYDLSRIREAVVARIAEENELFKPPEQISEESL
jgi:hypothetical protein